MPISQIKIIVKTTEYEFCVAGVREPGGPRPEERDPGRAPLKARSVVRQEIKIRRKQYRRKSWGLFARQGALRFPFPGTKPELIGVRAMNNSSNKHKG